MSNNKGNAQGLKVYTSHPYELIKTGFLVLTWIVLGTQLEIVGSTLGVLADNCRVKINEISTILVTRNAGYMAANLVGAILQKYVGKYPEALLSVSFLVSAIVVVSTPFITSLAVLSTFFFFQGVSQGVTDLGGTSLMLRMWGQNVAAPLNVVHLGFGFGAVFANLLVKGFIVTLVDDKTGKSVEIMMIVVPYIVISSFCVVTFVIHLVYSIIESKKKKSNVPNESVEYSAVSKEVVVKGNGKEHPFYSPAACGYGSFSYGLTMSIIFTFYMFFLSGNDQTFGKFFFVFLKQEKLQISANAATWGLIIYWLSYSVGRLICAFVTVFVEVHIAISGLWVCGFILAACWYIFVWVVDLTSTSLFVLGAFTGLVFSPTFPLSFAFLNQRLNPNPLLLALLLSGSACGGMVFQKIAGVVLVNDEKHFPTLLIICVICAIVLFILAMIISTSHKKKNKNRNQKVNSLNTNEEEQQMEIDLRQNQND